MAYSPTLLDAGALLLAVFIVNRLLAKKPAGRLPPGPRPLPLLGNALDMPQGHEWETFAKWGEQYGDIVSAQVFGQPYIILNSLKHATELLDKKSSIYSDRPIITVGGEWVGWDRFLGLLHYGNAFREFRRLAFSFMGTRKSVEKYHSVIESETRKFILHLADDASHLTHHIQRCAGAIILMISYGYKVQEGEDPFVKTVDEAMENFSISTSPGFLANIFPILARVPEWLPGTEWKRTARQWRACVDKMADEPIAWVKKQIAAGTAKPSFASTHLDEDTTPEQETLIKNVSGSLYAGGADTTVSAIDTFFLAMLVNPDVMHKAQAEIDAVVGPDRLPTIADRDQLPYVQALYLETLRWQQVAPLGIPHRLMEDDISEGYFLPKGSIVIANIWHMLHDPEAYPEPFTFNPNRFITTPTHEAERDSRDMAFGFGRRICPGLNLADVSVWLAVAMSLAVFDIGKAVENGHIVEPKVEYTTGTVSHPVAYKLSAKPRSSKAEALLRHLREQRTD